jgi:hypothetical protein
MPNVFIKWLSLNNVKGWNCSPQSIPLLQGGKTKGQDWHLITSCKKLPSFFDFTTHTQVISKRSYNWKWGR